MEFTCCWDCGYEFSVHSYAVCTLIAFDVSLIAYRAWQLRQLELQRYFRIGQGPRPG